MKLISRFEAAALSTCTLYRLRKEAFIAFSEASEASSAHRRALATMSVVEAELSARALRP